MGSSFKAPYRETSDIGTSTRGQRKPRLNSTAIAMIIAGVAAVAAPSMAFGQESVEPKYEKFDPESAKGKVEHGILKVSVDTGGWFSERKFTLSFPLTSKLTPEQLTAIEGQELNVIISGELIDGVFVWKAEPAMPMFFPGTMTCATVAPTPTAKAPDAAKTASAGKKAAGKHPEAKSLFAAGSTESYLSVPGSPGTFYVDRPADGLPIEENGDARGFDVTKEMPITFTVFGPATVQIHLYPMVPGDKAEREKMGKLKIKITIDDKTIDAENELPEGGEIKDRTLGGKGLWNKPLTTDSLRLTEGPHTITIEVPEADQAFWVTLLGANETIQPPEEDPDMPDSFETPCGLRVDARARGGYSFETTGSPIAINTGGTGPGYTPEIIPVHNSPLVKIRLTKGTPGSDDFAQYESTHGVIPGQESMCEFERTMPPAASTDHSGPEKLIINGRVSKTGDIFTFTPTSPTDPGLKCVVNNIGEGSDKANLHCWQDTGRGTRAYEAPLPTSSTALERIRRLLLRRK